MLLHAQEKTSLENDTLVEVTVDDMVNLIKFISDTSFSLYWYTKYKLK